MLLAMLCLFFLVRRACAVCFLLPPASSPPLSSSVSSSSPSSLRRLLHSALQFISSLNLPTMMAMRLLSRSDENAALKRDVRCRIDCSVLCLLVGDPHGKACGKGSHRAGGDCRCPTDDCGRCGSGTRGSVSRRVCGGIGGSSRRGAADAALPADTNGGEIGGDAICEGLAAIKRAGRGRSSSGIGSRQARNRVRDRKSRAQSTPSPAPHTAERLRHPAAGGRGEGEDNHGRVDTGQGGGQ